MKKQLLILLSTIWTLFILVSFSEKGTKAVGNLFFPKDEIKIGGQIWMTKNLNVDRFQNCDLIPYAKSEEEWIYAEKK